MSSLLMRRNKKLDDLKSSISILSISKKAQENIKLEQANLLPKGQTTIKDSNAEQEQSNLDHKIPQKLDLIPHSARFNIFRANTIKQFEDSQTTFEQLFQLEDKLGQGAHGVVKKCIHKQTNKIFAVKILQMEDEHYRSIKTNFINMKQLKHENIIRYKAIYLNRQKRICRLVMQYSPFSSLKPGLDENSLRFVFYKLLDALTYMHQKSICHRDIKPQNILCDIEKGIVKLIDFGVSKNMKLRGRYQQMLTNTGTCQYKAPEMFLGGSYTEKVDSWAVGITLFQMIAGHTPFQSEYHSDTINNITSKQVWFDSINFTKFSSLVKDLITRLLKKNPKERLTCEQAKKHLWFVPHLNDIDLMQSAGGFNIKNLYKSEESIGLTWFLERRSSVNEIEHLNTSKINKSQKQTIKRWLSVISEDHNNHTEEQYKFDFVESESEDEENPFIISATNLTSLESIKLQEKDSISTI